MECAKVISLDSVASIECQNVSFESNGSTLRVRRLGQKTRYRELFKIQYFSQILLRDFLLKLYFVDISSNDKMKLAFEKHGECFSILHIAKLIVPNASRCNQFLPLTLRTIVFISAPKVPELPKSFPLLKSSQFRGRSSNLHCRQWTGSCFIRALSLIKLFNSSFNQLS